MFFRVNVVGAEHQLLYRYFNNFCETLLLHCHAKQVKSKVFFLQVLLLLKNRIQNKICLSVINFLFVHTFVHYRVFAYSCLLQIFMHTCALQIFVHTFVCYEFSAQYYPLQIFVHTFVSYRFLRTLLSNIDFCAYLVHYFCAQILSTIYILKQFLCTLLSAIDFCAHCCPLQISDRGRNTKSCCQSSIFYSCTDFCAHFFLLQIFVHTSVCYKVLCTLLSSIDFCARFCLL